MGNSLCSDGLEAAAALGIWVVLVVLGVVMVCDGREGGRVMVLVH